MTRPLTRRLVPITVAGACLAAATAPALAQVTDTEPLTVQATGTSGSRTFNVYKPVGDELPGTLVLDAAGEQRFRVVVQDVAKGRSDGGFQVSTTMTNLYWTDPATGAYDPAAVIPSRNVSLGYDPLSALSATGISLPVLPPLNVTGTVPGCEDDTIATGLGIDPSLLTLTLDLLLAALDPVTASVCQALGTGLSVVGTATGGNVDLALTDQLLAGLPLSDLPVGLLGDQQSGAFTLPAYARKAAPFAPAGAPAATSKRVLTGKPGTSDALLKLVNDTLATAVGAPKALLTETQLLGLVAASGGDALTTNLLALEESGTTTAVDTVLAPLVAALGQLTALDLPKVTGTYTSRPVLKANTNAPRAGTYEGTLTVDFIDGIR